jgi:hypothetical protein
MISLPAGAGAPASGSYLWPVPGFVGSVSCATELTLDGHVALGPAITFGPAATRFPREVPLTIPINPALLPAGARARHLVVAYAGPAAASPRPVPVAGAQIVAVGGQWALSFMAPRLGTYQAFVADGPGAQTFPRKMTYRAIVGVGMGASGAASFGMRHHDRFDVLAPLGGPADGTWVAAQLEREHFGGFRSIAKGTQLQDVQLVPTACSSSGDCKPDETCLGVASGMSSAAVCVLMPQATEPHAHPQTFNTWWYELPDAGHEAAFGREAYARYFRDLAMAYGNPLGENLSPGGENLPAGVRPDDQSVTGDHPDGVCSAWVAPVAGDPGQAAQTALATSCPAERCAHPRTLSSYFDDEFNPDGVFPVITVCDGSPADPSRSPYADTWVPGGNNEPLEVALAVDYNGNGVRDELEPIVRAGHEPWRDHGVDGVPSAQEPGYAAGVNQDPAGDDFDAQYNPTGTEGDGRYQQGEGTGLRGRRPLLVCFHLGRRPHRAGRRLAPAGVCERRARAGAVPGRLRPARLRAAHRPARGGDVGRDGADERAARQRGDAAAQGHRGLRRWPLPTQRHRRGRVLSRDLLCRQPPRERRAPGSLVAGVDDLGRAELPHARERRRHLGAVIIAAPGDPPGG